MNDALDLWAYDGSFEIKALDDTGRFEGLAVAFDVHDLTRHRDRFTAETNYGRAMKSGADILYFHGLPEVPSSVKSLSAPKARNPLANKVIGDAEFKIVDPGVWMTGQLALRDEYEVKVWEMVKAGKLGLSTSTAAHRGRRVPNGDGTNTIKSWPIDEVSLTPIPANPRTSVYALKSLFDDPEPPESAGFVESLKSGASLLRWAAGREALNEVKSVAIDELRAALGEFERSRIDPAKLREAIALRDKIKARLK